MFEASTSEITDTCSSFFLSPFVRMATPSRNVYVKVSEVVRQREGEVVTDPDFYRPGLDVLLD